jgi:Na+-translocating ferredoxin:NAD+ oxidoreductase RnfG subunit
VISFDTWFRRLRTFSAAAGLAMLGVAIAGGKGVFYTDESARKELFPASTGAAADTLRIDSSTAVAAKALIRQSISEKEVVFERVLAGAIPVGYIYRGRERGKVELMDFSVALDTAGNVQRVLLTAYRENIGGEVGSKRFMDQFKGKKAGSALQLNRDIDGISGASLSSRAITVGVRKAVGFWKLKYAKA